LWWTTCADRSELLARLKKDAEAPWATWGGRPEGLTATKLGAILREYDIRSVTRRFPDETWPGVSQAKGYRRADFTDAWARYCPDDAGDPTDSGTTDSDEPDAAETLPLPDVVTFLHPTRTSRTTRTDTA
jgi:hypothetical protein